MVTDMNRTDMMKIIVESQRFVARIAVLPMPNNSRMLRIYADALSINLSSLYKSFDDAKPAIKDIKDVKYFDRIDGFDEFDEFDQAGISLHMADGARMITAPIIAFESANVRYELKPEPPALYQKYMIKTGDTLSEIAERFHTTVLVLKHLNICITNPDLIYAGSSIFVPVAERV